MMEYLVSRLQYQLEIMSDLELITRAILFIDAVLSALIAVGNALVMVVYLAKSDWDKARKRGKHAITFTIATTILLFIMAIV